MKVFVVMGNDFPEVVFAKEKDAQDFCAAKKLEKGQDGRPSRIHWRVYSFMVIA